MYYIGHPFRHFWEESAVEYLMNNLRSFRKVRKTTREVGLRLNQDSNWVHPHYETTLIFPVP
jgi:hypothetical protein